MSCSNHGCILRDAVPGAMGTNAICQCATRDPRGVEQRIRELLATRARLRAENETLEEEAAEMQQEIAGSIHTCGPTCEKTPNCRMRRENERLQVDMKTCRANYVSLNTRIDRLTKAVILRERERKGLLDLLELARDDVDHALFHLKQLHRQLPEYDAEMAKKQNILDRIDAAVKEQEDE